MTSLFNLNGRNISTQMCIEKHTPIEISIELCNTLFPMLEITLISLFLRIILILFSVLTIAYLKFTYFCILPKWEI